MGTVRFLDDPPFELTLAKPGKAYASEEIVWMIVPVFSLSPQRREHEIQVRMSLGEARGLARELERAASDADMHSRGASR
jgi:hypothetical protein